MPHTKSQNTSSAITSETQVMKQELIHPLFTVNALCFIPHVSKLNPKMECLFTHGYSASKSDLITWATRLSDIGVATLIFDLPGHYLGSFHEIKSFADFEHHAHELFPLAQKMLRHLVTSSGIKNFAPAFSVFGGHSLGALMALMSDDVSHDASHDTSKPTLNIQQKIYIAVGFGLNSQVKTHFFDTPLFQKTLNIRKQLVSPAIAPAVMFPWIKQHKMQLNLKQRTIALICGKDDVVVGEGGIERLQELLATENLVEVITPEKLPHHRPELAAAHIVAFLRKFLIH